MRGYSNDVQQPVRISGRVWVSCRMSGEALADLPALRSSPDAWAYARIMC